jgi:ADP-L-glycero-D-manno-heptose 6-epimerase
MRSVVHKAFHEIEATGSVSLFKSYRPDFPDGGQQRDFIYVKDAVKATLFLGEHADGGGLFNLGSGEPNTWCALVTAIYSALDRLARIKFIEMPEQLRDKYQYYTCANIAKLRSAGYVEPMTPLCDAVRDYVCNYLIPDRHLGDEAR